MVRLSVSTSNASELLTTFCVVYGHHMYITPLHFFVHGGCPHPSEVEQGREGGVENIPVVVPVKAFRARLVAESMEIQNVANHPARTNVVAAICMSAAWLSDVTGSDPMRDMIL